MNTGLLLFSIFTISSAIVSGYVIGYAACLVNPMLGDRAFQNGLITALAMTLVTGMIFGMTPLLILFFLCVFPTVWFTMSL